ncbi:MAG: hypothetical protein HYV07_10025 [Deltaproteobacteria bacterium]|nr:hypothetical protein [Deltaproteobacteria bacterium]
MSHQDARWKKLRGIWAEWGLKPDETQADKQREALEILAGWLEGGGSDLERIVRATQVLLLESARPDSHRRDAFRKLCEPLSDKWSNVGMDPQDIVVVKAMILACDAGHALPAPWRIATMMDLSWAAVLIPEALRVRLNSWRLDLPRAAERRPPPPHERAAPELPSVLSKERVSDFEWLEQEKGNAHRYNTFAPALLRVLHSIEASIKTLETNQGALLDVVVRLLQLPPVPSSEAVELELLWWGQARYCHALESPYRKLSPADRCWWAAWEVSKRAQGQHVEALASYLAEVLSACGDDVHERKSLSAWVSELIATDRRDNGPANSLKGVLASDALGLPVSWARAQSGERPPSADEFREQVGLDPSALVDRGDWAGWILRELLLERILAESKVE